MTARTSDGRRTSQGGASGTVAEAENDELGRLQRYVEAAFLQASAKPESNPQYCPRSLEPLDSATLQVKAVAFYLPQFHPFRENSAWWGEGFTEWTNVSKAKPQYVGHLQPRLPGELGFYDLRLPDVMHKQIALARHYGLDGFCFHHYWFNGRQLMDLPVRNFLADPTLDINFCLCWANENWSRRWDGSESDILIAQNHTPEDDIAFLDNISAALEDRRYIKVDGKPLLIVYRVSLLPNAAETAARWRARARERGLPGLYLVAARTFDMVDPQFHGFDAAVEFPPHRVRTQRVRDEIEIVNPKFTGRVFDYKDLADKYCRMEEEGSTSFKTVAPGWDNEARKPGAGQIYHGATPAIYAIWLRSAAAATMRRRPEERLLFINAWNEWAEGAYLEPDRTYGHGYLNATATVLREFSK
jgi:lipopolysaccharide biosynthesis protein